MGEEQAEASTLLHESSNSEPETIEQREIVFHYIRVRVARVGVIPLVGAKPATVDRKHTHTHSRFKLTAQAGRHNNRSCRPTCGDKDRQEALAGTPYPLAPVWAPPYSENNSTIGPGRRDRRSANVPARSWRWSPSLSS